MGEKIAKTSIRLTKEEQEHILLQCEKYGIKSSEYMRRLIEQDMGRLDVKNLEYQNIYLQRKELINEIHRIGVNINQIVHNVNCGYYINSEKRMLFGIMKKLLSTVEERL